MSSDASRPLSPLDLRVRALRVSKCIREVSTVALFYLLSSFREMRCGNSSTMMFAKNKCDLLTSWIPCVGFSLFCLEVIEKQQRQIRFKIQDCSFVIATNCFYFRFTVCVFHIIAEVQLFFHRPHLI